MCRYIMMIGIDISCLLNTAEQASRTVTHHSIFIMGSTLLPRCHYNLVQTACPKLVTKSSLSRMFTDHLSHTKDVAGTKAVFRNRRLGPFEVVQVIGDNAYKLRLPAMWKAHDVVNISYLTPAHDGSERYLGREPPPPDHEIIGGEQHCLVEGLHNHHHHNGYLQYFVKFEGYPIEPDEWLFIADLREDMDPATIKRLGSEYKERRALEEDLPEDRKPRARASSVIDMSLSIDRNNKTMKPGSPESRQVRRSARIQARQGVKLRQYKAVPMTNVGLNTITHCLRFLRGEFCTNVFSFLVCLP